MLKSCWVFWNRGCIKVLQWQGHVWWCSLRWLCSQSWIQHKTALVVFRGLSALFLALAISQAFAFPAGIVACLHWLDRFPVLCVVMAVRKFLPLPARLAFGKLYLSLLSPSCITPFSHYAYLILPLDFFLIHSREVWQTSKSSAVVTSPLARRRTDNLAFSHGWAN